MRRLILISMVVLLSSSMSIAQEPCTADFDCNGNVDADDVTVFLTQFGRSPFNNPCPDCYDSPCPCSTCITCSGTLSPLGRWCDQGDGTVKDMTTGLVWLKDVGWGGQKVWADCTTWDDAHTRAGTLYAGMPGAGLSDGSVVADWRLPTQSELVDITRTGDEYIRYNQMYFFTGGLGIPNQIFWTSTTLESNNDSATCVYADSSYGGCGKQFSFYVWPVRGGH
jgi:hypothetical protein